MKAQIERGNPIQTTPSKSNRARVLPSPISLTLLALCICLAPPLVGGAETRDEQGRKDDPCMGSEGFSESWLDRSHDYLSKSLCEPAVWFDNFFGDPRADQEGHPGTFIRWKLDFRFEEDEGFAFRTRIHAQVRVPRVTRRLSLVLNGEDEDNPSDILPDDPLDPGFDQEGDDNQANIGIRFEIIDKPKSRFYIQPGVRFKDPLEPYVRVRYRYTLPLGRDSLARFTQTLFWIDREGFGETTRVDLERLLNPRTMLRWSNAATYSETSMGIDWGTELSLFQQLSERRAISVEGGASGFTRPSAVVDEYRIGYRYRQNFFKRWLFFELEPEVSWPRDENDDRVIAGAVTFRLEVQIGRW